MSEALPHVRLKQAGVHADLIGDEAIVISFASGRYYTIRGTGAYIIGALTRGPVERGDVFSTLAIHYGDVPSEKLLSELNDFFTQLKEEGLIEFVYSETTEPELKLDGPYGFQKIEIEARLANLLTLDPIHEVSAEGWPKRS